jgi:hypothetical protein
MVKGIFSGRLKRLRRLIFISNEEIWKAKKSTHSHGSCYRFKLMKNCWIPSNALIVEPRISRYWVSSIKEDVKTTIRLFFSFPEWANEELFYHNLIEGQRREMGLFARYKQLMDLEFPNPAVTQFAQVGDNSWLICPFCSVSSPL